MDEKFFAIKPDEKDKRNFKKYSLSQNESTEHSSIDSKVIFNRQIYMYTIVFPAIKNFGMEKSYHYILDNIVRPYHFHNGNLIWDEVAAYDFKCWNKFEVMDLPRLVSLLKSLGRWHGSVMAFRHRKPKEFEFLCEKLYNTLSIFFSSKDILKTIAKYFGRVLGMLKKVKRFDLVQKYEKKFGTLGNILVESVVRHPVISFHADCWVNNIVFNTECLNSSIKEKMYFNSFHLSMTDSPIRDISYLIYCYIDKNSLDDFDFLLHAYHSELTTTIAKLGDDPDEIFPFKEFKREWRKYGMFGLVMMLFEVFDESEVYTYNDEKKKDDVEVNDDEVLWRYNERVIKCFIQFGENFL
ncbi:hypothetical protein HHI36_016456 [Cryptolaemus montrouzieri]|uniref:CHK kinase-like domain-containing protein n=1 Tax=Cryptolaemus montrouzieri TaxID=559131 RepID=A0ABD2NJW7_9CUCU